MIEGQASRLARLALLAAVFTLGCASPREDAPAGAAEAAEPAAAAAAPSLTDPEVAHVAVTANAIDVELAELARARTGDAGVRRFAQTMITDHTAVNERAAALAERLGVVPLDNAVSRQLREGAAAVRARLEGLSGPAFDRAYMEREAAYHQAVLDALDQLLIPSAANGELRSLLEAVRPAIVAHLEHAKSMGNAEGGGR